jgi:hypothetical protein
VKRIAAAVALACLALPLPALAQMPDPSMMSGIPRPDPTVPPGKLVVRVIRGDFAHPLVGTEVTLDGPDTGRTARVGDDGRANFEGLPLGGPYVVSAKSGDQTVGSQKIDLPAEAGVKVMLVFKPDEKASLGEHDGEARPDRTLPAGTLVIHVVDEAGRAMPNLPLLVAHGRAPAGGGAPKIEQTALTTDAAGEVRYLAPAGGLDEGYMVNVKREPLRATSKPFTLDKAAGMRLGLRAAAVSSDATALSINRRSHLILDVKDEGMEVVENLAIENGAGAPYDPGPSGVVFRLPLGATSAAAIGENPPGFTVKGDVATLRGPIAPGVTQLAFGFVLPLHEGGVELRQTLPLRMDQVVAVTSTFAGMDIRGDGIRVEERKLSGRRFNLVSGGPVAAGGTLRLEIAGVPTRSRVGRDLAVAASLAVAAWAVWAAWLRRRGANGGERERLLADRKQLLDELAALQRKPSGSAKAEAKSARRHDELMERLERVMRDLDDYAD